MSPRRKFGHGGARPGSGRPPGPDPAPRHKSRERFGLTATCHVTLRVQPDVPSLRSARLVRELEETFSRGTTQGNFDLLHYGLERDRAHFLLRANGRDALANLSRSLGARFSRAVNRVFERRGRVLKHRYELRVLRSPSELRDAVRLVTTPSRELTVVR